MLDSFGFEVLGFRVPPDMVQSTFPPLGPRPYTLCAPKPYTLVMFNLYATSCASPCTGNPNATRYILLQNFRRCLNQKHHENLEDISLATRPKALRSFSHNDSIQAPSKVYVRGVSFTPKHYNLQQTRISHSRNVTTE